MKKMAAQAKLGVMIDMSRNAVMSMDGLKRFFRILSQMGYNCVMLYTEDTYEVDGEPYFGYMRGRYSKQEIRELDQFAATLGIELIPCIQTLAHLNATIRWNTFPTDCDDILLVDDPRSYELIDHMFKTVSECFTTKNIHIGMDEAHMLGRGRHLDIFGYETSGDCMKRHLRKVREIGEKYGFKMMMWSDMFFYQIKRGQYYMEKTEIPDSVKEMVDPSICPVFWDYYHFDEEIYDSMIYNHKQLSDDIWFAGGIWSWQGLVPLNADSIKSMIPAINACKKQGIDKIFFTMWGDNGGECSHFSQLPAMFYLAEYLRGNTDEADIKAKFKAMFGITYDDFIALDLPNQIDENRPRYANPSKYMLYSDYFNGFLDHTVNGDGAEKYAAIAETLNSLAQTAGEFSYLFDCEAKLCEVLALKYDIGVKTRKAYQTNDREALRKLTDIDYPEIADRLRSFHAAFEKQWFFDNKTSGFDVQDIRLGGLIQRTESCRRRLSDFLDGKIERIAELEESVLPYPNSEAGCSICYNSYAQSATANIL